MSARLTEWLSRLASVKGDSRQALIRCACQQQWDLQDFEEHVVLAPSLPRQLVDALTPYEVAAMQRTWKQDFEPKRWGSHTFDFLSRVPTQTWPQSRSVRDPQTWPQSRSVQPQNGRRAASVGAMSRPLRTPPVLGREAVYNDVRMPVRSSLGNVPVMRDNPRGCSTKWHEGQPVVSEDNFLVDYMGGLLEVGANEVYYVDNSGRILVGVDGTTSPPCGMNGQPLVECSGRQPNFRRAYGNFAQAAPAVRSGRPHSAHRLRPPGQPGSIQMASKFSSSNFEEARPRVSRESFLVQYSGGDLVVEANEVYYIDNSGRVLVGWNGTMSPPCAMDGQPLVDDSDAWGPDPSLANRPYLSNPDAWRRSSLLDSPSRRQMRLQSWTYPDARRGAPRLSSNFWEQGRPEVSDRPFIVKHANGNVQIEANEVHYVDDLGRVLVGWYGSVSPPCDVNGNSLVMY